MVRKRVIAHYMHEKELGLASDALENKIVKKGYIYGEIEEESIPELREKGIIIQVFDEDADDQPPFGLSQELQGAQIRQQVVYRGKRKGFRKIDYKKPNFYFIHLAGPLLREWIEEFDDLGVHLLDAVDPYKYAARLQPEQAKQVNRLPFVLGLRVIKPEDKGPTFETSIELLEKIPPSDKEGVMSFDIRLYVADDLDTILKRLKKLDIEIIRAKKRRITINLPRNRNVIKIVDRIKALHEVSSIVEFVRYKLHNDVARMILGLDRVVDNEVESIFDLNGDGQIVAVADTGIDVSHPDLKDRIFGTSDLGREKDVSDPDGHGTHVAGAILGEGKASNGKIKGVAPGAKLFFQSLLDEKGEFTDKLRFIEDIFEEAYDAGARIHNNSWGAETRSHYTMAAEDVDEFIYEHPDMLIIFSAGNAGQAAVLRNSPRGYPDLMSISSPASAKNILCVGANRTSRTQGGRSALTHKDVWPDKFPNPPMDVEKISGNTEALAGFSSRGPCTNYMIKPDVVAPGTDIVSTRSSIAPMRNYWGPYPKNDKYMYLGGTSMSAPIVTGCVALIREYYEKKRYHNPSAALLKATIINSTKMLKGKDAIDDYEGLPNFNQGFGLVYLPYAIPNKLMPDMRLEFLDTWSGKGEKFYESGDSARYYFDFSGKGPLRFCLAYTDSPTPGLKYIINIVVDHEGGPMKWLGNENLPLSLSGPDTKNNVEIIRLEDAPAGRYYVKITANNMHRKPQDYALVVTGDLTSSLIEA